MNAINRFLRSFFCRHEFKIIASPRYAVMRADGTQSGEVTVHAFECVKCGEAKIVPSDRTYFQSAQKS